MLQFDANANVHVNVDASVNGPLPYNLPVEPNWTYLEARFRLWKGQNVTEITLNFNFSVEKKTYGISSILSFPKRRYFQTTKNVKIYLNCCQNYFKFSRK